MKKHYKVVLLIVIIIAASFGIYILWFTGVFYSSWGHYDDSELNNMGVIFDNIDDIHDWRNGYSTIEECPWEHSHSGLDYFFSNGSKVIAATAGQVIGITFDDEEEGENQYTINLVIRFNRNIVMDYNFEPWTNNETNAKVQWENIFVEKWDWVSKGDHIADFIAYDSDAHIHFDINENWQAKCPQNYFDEEGYDNIMGLAHKFQPTWDLCYS